MGAQILRVLTTIDHRSRQVAPLMENPAEVTIVDFGPRGWVLVTYDKKYLKLATEANPEGGGKVRSLDQLRPCYRGQTPPTGTQVTCQAV